MLFGTYFTAKMRVYKFARVPFKLEGTQLEKRESRVFVSLQNP